MSIPNASNRPSPAMLVALIALFMSLGGTATAAKVLIDGKNIRNGTIAASKLTKKARHQLTAHARTAGRARLAESADSADSLTDEASGDTLLASSTPTPGELLPLDADGHFSPSASPNIAARIYSSADEAVPIGGVKMLTFDRVSFDTAHLFDQAHATRLKAPVNGVYLINANISWQISSAWGLNRAVYVYVNGYAISVDQRPPATETRQVVTTLYRLKAGDEVEVGVAQDEAGSLNVNAVGDYAPSLAIALIAPG